jgi:hypothetical protein
MGTKDYGRDTMTAADDDDAQAEYLRFLERVKPGALLTEDEWLFHFDHQNRDAQSGLAAGDEAPPFTLPDQTGAPRNRDELTGDQGLLLAFVRSADW